MTAKDLAACSSDNTSNLKLADDTINALSDLLKGIQLSEDHATEILGAVRAITNKHSDMRPPMSELPTSTDTVSDTAAPSTGGVSPVSGQLRVDQEALKIPSGHYVVTHNGTDFILPFRDQSEPFYLITKGKLVGMFLNW
ncbi:hypothetical protein JVT61DRAFT_7496 [Boletus reticuloceps]|uniref:Uncharacterized protein n=1 Tax=Boletus reticuloceps TaxID=495285 RepID=A0A8I3A773_9AGAM|nr:hypothetical protein JVT61DRAFT_7496 [Boletus reticuloceps]